MTILDNFQKQFVSEPHIERPIIALFSKQSYSGSGKHTFKTGASWAHAGGGSANYACLLCNNMV